MREFHFVGGVGRNQVESAVDGVAVRVDEAGEQALAFQVDAFDVWRNGLCYVGKSANRDDLVAANGDSFGVGILRVSGEDFGVEENLLMRGCLRESRVEKKECCC